jgi:hypothetical protein
MRSLPISIPIVTLALVINMILAFADGPDWLVGVMFVAGPFLIVWMVLHVLMDRSAPMPDLPEGDEWGYRDRPELRPRR